MLCALWSSGFGISHMTLKDRSAQLLSLEGKVAMVTGAASGIGHGIAVRLAEMGAFVAVLDVDEEKGKAAVQELGSGFFLKCDVRSAADCKRAVEIVIQRHRRIDILCNCAGIAIRKDVVELSEEEWDRALDVTLKSVYLLSHEVVPHMIRG